MNDEQLESLSEEEVSFEIGQYQELFDRIRPLADSDMCAWLVTLDYKRFFDEQTRRVSEQIEHKPVSLKKWKRE